VTSLERRRVLVTGAGGFIGSHLVRLLLAEGADVFAMSDSVSLVYPIRLAACADAITVVEANVNDRSSMDDVAATVKPDFVVHLAAFTHVGKSFRRVDENIQTNIQGTVNLLQALDGEYERFVYVGTSEIYGDVAVPFVEDGPVNPISPYSVAKYAAERYCRMFHQAYGWPIVCLRPFNAYGPWQTADRIIPEIILSGLRGRELRLTEGRQTRDFTFVTDVAEGFLHALTAPGVEGEVFNIGSGEEVSMRDLTRLILELMGNPIRPAFGALPERPTEIWRMFCDNAKARVHLDWKPSVPLAEGLTATVDWYREQFEARSPFVC